MYVKPPPSEETKKKISRTLTGRKMSEETKKKISKTNKGKKLSCSGWNKGLTRETDKRVLKNTTHRDNCQCSFCQAKRGKRCGANHPCWKGGISALPYPFEFNEELKALIRERDGHICQLCSKTREEEGKNLAVHHVDYVKENLDPKNLITLCCSCNVKVNYNHKLWKRFLNRKLKLKIG